MVGGLTALTGRAQRAPSTALTTGLVLPTSETGAFLRKARLSVGQAVVDAPAEGQLKALGFSLFTAMPGEIRLAPQYAPAGWDTTYDDRGQTSLLARSNNLFSLWATQRAALAQRQAEPNLRPWLIWRTGTTGSARWGTPEWRTVSGTDDLGTLGKVFSAGVSGLGSLQVRLDIQGLADPARAATTWRGLQTALFNPYLVLDAGSDPQAWYAGLSDRDKKRLKAVLDRRSALKPYLSEVLRQGLARGLPAIKPLWFNYPGDAKARAATDEFLLGDTMLVAPALDGQSTRKVYLPGGGVWFMWPQDEELAGGQTYDVPTSEDLPTLFVKAGSFTPVREPEVYDGKATFNPLTLHLFPGAQNRGEYSVDDGLTRNWESGLITTMGLEFTYLANAMDINTTVIANGPLMKYSDPYLLIRLHKVYNPKQVKIDGKAIPKYGDSFGITDTDRSAAWYENDNTLLLKIFSPEKAQTISLTFSQLQ